MRYCLALDLQPDPALIAEYEAWHRDVWPEIRDSILDSGISDMQIWRLEDRLFMIIETSPGFTFENKAAMDAANPAVQRWEQLMWKYQLSIPGGKPAEKWRVMQHIFSLNRSTR
jgi:L-rhamnose mutarotase